MLQQMLLEICIWKLAKKQGLTVMISAHSYEIGLQVVYIDKAGFVSLLSGENFSG